MLTQSSEDDVYESSAVVRGSKSLSRDTGHQPIDYKGKGQLPIPCPILLVGKLFSCKLSLLQLDAYLQQSVPF
jgi:hypothetical protein